MTALLALAAVVGYLLGALSPASFAAARRGVDLRGVGSGNPGAANVGRALGRRTGAVVALLDLAKGALPSAAFGALDHRAGLVAGIAAVLGHVSSPFLRGKGGKGVATAAGAILGSHPLWFPVALLTWLLGVAVTRWIALASMLGALSTLVVALVEGHDRLWAAALTAVIVARHRDNVVRRLAAGRGDQTAGEQGPADG